MTRLRHNRGFTIVEVMLAVSIIAALTGLMWVSIAQMYKTRDIVDMRSERFQAIRILMDRLTQEMASAYVAGPEFGGEYLPGEEPTTDEAEESDTLSPDERIQFGMIGRSDFVHFTTFGHQRTFEGEKAGYSVELGYFLRSERNEDGDLVQVLVRRQDTSPDDDITRGGVIYRVFEDVEEIKFEYWDAGAVKIGDLEEVAQGRWVDRWDTTRREFAGRMPSRIRITVSLPPQGPRGSMEVFTTQTHVAITEVLEY